MKTGPWASFLLLLCLLGCGKADGDKTFRHQGNTMGTGFHVTVVLNNGEPLPFELAWQIDQELARINGLMSTYLNDSELVQFNELGIDSPFSVSDDFCHLLLLSQQVYDASNGAFNPAVGPLVNLWGFGPGNSIVLFDPNADLDSNIPAPEDIDRLLKEVNFESLVPDCNGQTDPKTITKQQAVSLDFSAIAKGYAADKVGQLIQQQGFANYLVEVGGELALSGTNSLDSPWRIAIEKPSLLQGGVQKLIRVTDAGVATSGDYRNYFEKDGKRYSHTIDPRTGRPITHNLASVTVIAKNTATADALATAYMVLGVEEAIKLAERDDVAAYFMVKDDDQFIEQASSRFLDYTSPLDGEN